MQFPPLASGKFTLAAGRLNILRLTELVEFGLAVSREANCTGFCTDPSNLPMNAHLDPLNKCCPEILKMTPQFSGDPLQRRHRQTVFGFAIQVSWLGGQLCFGRDRFGAAG